MNKRHSHLDNQPALTAEERLTLADRIRAMSPCLHDVDLVAMIREDRDSRSACI